MERGCRYEQWSERDKSIPPDVSIPPTFNMNDIDEDMVARQYREYRQMIQAREVAWEATPSGGLGYALASDELEDMGESQAERSEEDNMATVVIGESATTRAGSVGEEPTQSSLEGKLVRLISSSYGWGSAKKGDLLYVESIDPYGTINGRLQATSAPYICVPADVEEVSKEESSRHKRKLDVEKEPFVQACKSFLLWHRDDIAMKAREVENRVTQHSTDLRVAQRDLLDIRTLAKSASSRASNAKLMESMSYQCDTLIHQYEHIERVERGIIEAVTNHIEYDAEHNMRIIYGKYIVAVDMEGHDVRVKPVNTEQIRSGYAHPNVSYPSGGVCFGTYQDSIITAMASNDLARTLMLMFDLLNNLSDQGAFVPHGYWAKDASKRCHGCWKIANKCRCKEDVAKCGHCENSLDDCSCVICPNSGEVLENNIFPDPYCTNGCQHYKEGKEDGTVYHYCHLNQDLLMEDA